MFAKLSIQIQIDEVAYTKIQSLLQREKPTPNEIKVLVDNLIKDNFIKMTVFRKNNIAYIIQNLSRPFVNNI